MKKKLSNLFLVLVKWFLELEYQTLIAQTYQNPLTIFLNYIKSKYLSNMTNVFKSKFQPKFNTIISTFANWTIIICI